ncbi:DUF3082 domain-containing protein [Laspinema olomoucense]|uniref:DUF3082 domain-containing protein n=1 Tax=Laspinema olomoucense TaxID=3231600 RepID=UPI0021BAFF1C|nr:MULTISPECIES: DUF3082 domain-containing protein [unclassified Laspinema]MCT7989129.1 DUF3082 domain-containing protein [Laspinema sp. D3a]MCT7993396.1 DUF3082 domain-containing protein [Laspinema sp. D3c]
MSHAGQEYHWAVEAVINGSPTPIVENSEFQTPLPPSRSSSSFTSVTVLTRGVEAHNNEGHNRLLDSQINAIASTFANKPIHSDNPIAVNISAAVRTLVTGVSTLATFIFAFAALGLFCLGLQLLFQKVTKTS